MSGNTAKKRTPQRLLRLSAVALAVGAATPSQTLALEFAAATELGARYNSNARRSVTSEDADVVFTPSFIAEAFHEGNGVSMVANYRLFRRMFKEDFFEDENRLTGYANINWEPIFDRFDIRLTQNRNESTRQSFGRGTQDDRQIISTSEVAPRLRFQLRGTDELQLEYQFTDTTTDEEDIDNERQSATARYVWGVSDSIEINLSATQGETRYEFEGVPQIDFTTYMGGIDYERGRNRLELSGGQSIFEREGQPDVKGPVWDATWSHQFSANTSLRLGASQSITDRSQELLDVDSRDYEELGFSNSDLTDIFESNIAFAELSRNFGATSLALMLRQAESDFERVPRDETNQMATLSARRLLRRELEGQASLVFNKVNYDQLPTDFDQLRLELSVLWDVNRRFETEGGVFLMKRNGRGAAGDFDDYGFFLVARYFFAGQNSLDDDR